MQLKVGLTSRDVDAEVLSGLVLERVLLAELVQDVGRVKARIVTELTWDDLECLRVRIDEQLRLARYRPGVVSQIPGPGCSALIKTDSN